ncbi:hypothetical protein IFM89_030905 [Coptis chinensis]|uniref:Transcription factor MYC/MYB N-terminal domain-containing protein n=1 Tax=Coptis chinensis TaxID=261450 RepID=A0A835I2D7_9MAGN|nr:hypothetical protein IFM89_030905 [Coptis chinensis]
MVGSGGSDRSKEAVGMMALHEALRNICLNSDWTYSVFWSIRPRPRTRGGTGCKVGDESGSLMLMWEDGFCQRRVADCLEDIDGEDQVRKAFSKMSIQLYNYGEGLMGKVASDKCHKWVFKEPPESEANISNYWQSSFDALPSEWTDQFNSGIQTIAVIQAGHGLLQLGSCEIIPEDLHFVLRMRHTFETLGHQSGFYLSQLFSATRNTSSPISAPLNHTSASSHPPAPIFNWNQRPLQFPANIVSHNFQNTTRHGLSLNKNEMHPFVLPHSSDSQMGNMMADHDSEIKWPNGLSFFNALTGQSDNSKLLFGSDGLGNKSNQPYHPLVRRGSNINLEMNICRNADEPKNIAEVSNSLSQHGKGNENADANNYLSLENHPNNVGKMQDKFRRSFTLPARMASSSSSSSLDHHQNQHVDYRGSEAGIYSDIMETFLE